MRKRRGAGADATDSCQIKPILFRREVEVGSLRVGGFASTGIHPRVGLVDSALVAHWRGVLGRKLEARRNQDQQLSEDSTVLFRLFYYLVGYEEKVDEFGILDSSCSRIDMD